MSTTETRAIIERAIALGMENYEAIGDELHSEDVVKHGQVEDDYRREAWKRRQAQFIDAFKQGMDRRRAVRRWRHGMRPLHFFRHPHRRLGVDPADAKAGHHERCDRCPDFGWQGGGAMGVSR